MARPLQTACLDGVVRRALRSILIATPVIALVLGLGWIGKLWYDSRLPGTYSVMGYGTPEYGGGTVPPLHGSGHTQTGTSVEDLHGHGRAVSIRVKKG